MKRLTSAEVRQKYLDFFKEKGHAVEPSASLVPHEDPSLLWINSGVATLKKYFDGRVVPDNPRIVNAQKSIRTNDIENVGKTARHHTFFEMLGNFSIGDYFKKEAIEWGWEFLTDKRWIGFEPERLAVTIYPDDEEAYKIWHENVGLPDERIIRLEENFWDIGEGPCGPNTEIFYDRGPAFGDDPDDPEMYPGGENERHLEIWNLVFSQFNHNPDGSYTPLPKKNIDTGMGLERVVSVIQDAETNFDTDLFLPLIRQTESISGKTYNETAEMDTAFKVVADHIRTVTFATGDGALPSNEGRGYVLRRLLRRAVRYAKQLDIHEPFMYRLVPTVGEIMNEFYPEVAEKSDFIAKVIRTEEERFHETLNDGLKMLNELIRKAKAAGKTAITGEDSFKLYDTYGFPVDLTEEYVEEAGLAIDREGFDREMAKQRERARAARQESDSMQLQDDVLGQILDESRFVGYDQHETATRTAVLIKENARADFATEGDELHVILDETPFYAESGGQVADTGTIATDSGVLNVSDVQKAPNGQHLHRAVVVSGSVKEGEAAKAAVASSSRKAIVKNHTATHLLHQALKDVLGDHVSQSGSYVGDERLRFDFSHFGQMTEAELEEAERLVNEKVWQSIPVEAINTTLDKAKEMGATALFGEKYGQNVRAVQVGDYSLELCGGCHVDNTAEIGLFKIVSEAGIGAGIRRVEAVTGKEAYQFMNGQVDKLREAAGLLKTNLDDVPYRVSQLQQQLREKEKETESLQAKLSRLEAGSLLNEFEDADGVPVLAKKVDAADMNGLRKMVDSLKEQTDSAVIVLGTVNGGKVNIVASVSKDLVEQGQHAGQIVKEVAQACGGNGGGRPDMAQAGGKDPAKLDEALQNVAEIVKTHVK
ncbi:alanine--tRNA ligase [Salisediminibacterium halotolerans]|uniref:alanine--tRNA ligase n=1 Tax=Salisediminibacterium halotolerans TaxID=517425 RepID=UPI000EB1C399|nr:alanine--tRNA ligase [Salisediminibacterium halotolerans]RLJ78362.1 alanyl-tRNA synthetase [Actinophytocola xinjiangensis]RPE88296.1 alanyl-tRNA synthetase [Salisediminibacterium halotolerans]TWG37338.1 alanyl-tRNA synthetase [Salisediminibacterium halotolerans]GEL06803.1 alanine--tRNA ligase [Salisediminibacterium halotolerans]